MKMREEITNRKQTFPAHTYNSGELQKHIFQIPKWAFLVYITRTANGRTQRPVSGAVLWGLLPLAAAGLGPPGSGTHIDVVCDGGQPLSLLVGGTGGLAQLERLRLLDQQLQVGVTLHQLAVKVGHRRQRLTRVPPLQTHIRTQRRRQTTSIFASDEKQMSLEGIQVCLPKIHETQYFPSPKISTSQQKL